MNSSLYSDACRSGIYENSLLVLLSRCHIHFTMKHGFVDADLVCIIAILKATYVTPSSNHVEYCKLDGQTCFLQHRLFHT